MPALVSYNLTMTIYACTEAIIAFANRAPNGVEDHRADASTQSLPFLAAGAPSPCGTLRRLPASNARAHSVEQGKRGASARGRRATLRLTAAAHHKRRKESMSGSPPAEQNNETRPVASRKRV